MNRGTAALGVTTIIVALTGVTAAGVQAASKNHHYTACASKSGALSLEKHGKCGGGSKKVTIDSTGPAGRPGTKGPPGGKGSRGLTGPQGPGEVTTNLTSPASFSTTVGPAVETGITGVTVTPVCASTAGIYVDGTSGASIAQGEASVQAAESGDAQVGYASEGSPTDLGPGGNAIYETGTLSVGEQLKVVVGVGTGTTAGADGQVVVFDGGGSFTMQFALEYDATTCTATAVVTPSATAS